MKHKVLFSLQKKIKKNEKLLHVCKTSAADVIGAIMAHMYMFFSFLGCPVYGSTYQALGGFRIFFADKCLLDMIEDITLEECFGFCNIRERCLQIRHVYGDALCFLSQCSPGLYPDLWDFSTDQNVTTTHVRNCAGNNIIGKI